MIAAGRRSTLYDKDFIVKAAASLDDQSTDSIRTEIHESTA